MVDASRPWSGLAIAALCVLLIAPGAMAQEKNDALRKSQLQVRKLQQEKTALEAKLSAAEQEKALATKEKDNLNAQVSNAQARAKSEMTRQLQMQQALDAATREKAELQNKRTELEGLLAALTTKQAATERELGLNANQKKQLEGSLQDRKQQIAQCEDKNLKLYSHGRDLINQCRDRSFADTVLRVEPFSGLGKVDMENLMEEYRTKLDASKLVPGAVAN